MDGRIKSGHDGVEDATVVEQEAPGAARPIGMPPPHVMPGLDPGIHWRRRLSPSTASRAEGPHGWPDHPRTRSGGQP